jgi:hypothetical protein
VSRLPTGGKGEKSRGATNREAEAAVPRQSLACLVGCTRGQRLPIPAAHSSRAETRAALPSSDPAGGDAPGVRVHGDIRWAVRWVGGGTGPATAAPPSPVHVKLRAARQPLQPEVALQM